MNYGKNIFSLKWAIFVCYIILSLQIGEMQPFTKVPMYDSFPNWSYIFYLRDENEKIIFPRKEIHHPIDIGAIAHIFYSYCNEKEMKYGYGEEDPQQLLEAGDFIIQKIKDEWPNRGPRPKEIYLVRRHIYYNEIKVMTEKDNIIGHAFFDSHN